MNGINQYQDYNLQSNIIGNPQKNQVVSQINPYQPPPTGSTILNNQQFIQSTLLNQPQRSNILNNQQNQPQSSNFYDPKSLLYSRPLNPTQKNSQMNDSNNYGNDNWTEANYKREFTEWKNVIQKHQDFIQKLEAVRLEMPKISVLLKDIQRQKLDILALSNCQNWSIFQDNIRPKSNEIQEQIMQLQQSLSLLKESNQIPKNQYKSNSQDNQAISQLVQFSSQVQIVKTEIYSCLQQLDSLLDDRKNILNQKDNYQQELEKASIQISDYLRNRLSQSIESLVFIYEREIFNLDNTINQQLYQQDMTSITFFLEKISIIDGLMQLFQERKKNIKQHKEELNRLLSQKISSFDVHFEQVAQFYNQYKTFYLEIKQIQQITNEPILQSFQIKTKSQILSQAQQIWQQIKQLYFCGENIKKFNFQEKLNYFEKFNIQAQVSYIIDCVQELKMKYIKRGTSIPINEAKKVKDLLYKAESQYQQTNQIRLELQQLETYKFKVYQDYIAQQMRPKLEIDFGKLYYNDFYEIIYFQFADALGIAAVKELMQFQFPKFDWNEEIQDEQSSLKLVQTQLKDAEELYVEFLEKYSKELKFVKQLNNWKSELTKCTIILQQYLHIKQQLEGQMITLLKWPSIELQEIFEFSVHCEQICRQANSYVLAIRQLDEMNLIAQIEILLQEWNPLIKDKIHEICQYISERTFSCIISEQVMIAYEYLYLCHECLSIEIDQAFCQTNTYDEFEEMMCGKNRFQQIKSQYNNNVYDVELRYKLFEIIDKFMKEKIILDFQQLFEYKLQQSQNKTSNYDPILLSKRTDLLYPINRIDINTNQYCLMNMNRIQQIIDQPDLRDTFIQFRELLKQITIIMDQDKLESDIEINQNTIIELINSFSNQLMIQNELINVQPMIVFHQQLLKQAKSFNNAQINLGIVLNEEYQLYLKSCRKRILRMRKGICIEFTQPGTLTINGVQYNMNEIPHIYRDTNSVILEQMDCTIKSDVPINKYEM